MEQERKVLGILAIIFGGIALIGSWMPIINNLSFIIAILALILGVIGLFVNKKRPKTLAIIGTVIAVVSMAIVLGTQAMYAKSLDNLSKDIEKTTISTSSSNETSKKEEKTKFNWFVNTVNQAILTQPQLMITKTKQSLILHLIKD